MTVSMTQYARKLALAGISIQAMKLSPRNPFQWASGYRMPVYNDNRMFLFYYDLRQLIGEAFEQIIREEDIAYDVIAGTATAGIPIGTVLAERLKSPFVYVRSKPKDHGLRNRIEGIDAGKDLEGRRVILIEDLISTGGSSVDAVTALRNSAGKVEYCLSIFNYELPGSLDLFDSLEPPCKVRSILTYDTLVETAAEEKFLDETELQMLQEWRRDPFNWGEMHGFPRVIKGD